ncbi:phytanoyl-CoA dioxygenase family protein [Paenibacillus sp. MWE-103]|uniref:Phytanoyl-CoA dioxygenase family protein n=1 Tax=Paenibacillus artemisiicola TaxID=1172618 RepID=A0ABS3W5F2_9BACL|nr:phytanoyl-CoA dioxygenase family protein [Paenibacillus artemisiicola]MBO7743528.1 phytanoyl-CoA dioxygenase family protein [Paenibacillus artemisiicola]
MNIQLSEEERKNGRMDADKLEFATALLRANGAIIIEDVLGAERTDYINEAFTKVLTEFEKNYVFGDGEFNAGGATGNVRMDLPFAAPFIEDDVVANPIFLDIAEQILGRDLTLRYLASNNSMPGGTKKQPVHSDTGPLFPETFNFTTPIHSLVLHVPLCDFTELNGATEFYPGGTHLNPDHVFKNGKMIQKLGEAMHFQAAIMPKGSFLIRDKKTWHRGCPNRSDKPRGLFTFIYQRAWDATSGRMPIPRNVYDNLSERAKQLFRMEDISDAYEPMDNVKGLYHIRRI